jgi:hypothetical protein
LNILGLIQNHGNMLRKQDAMGLMTELFDTKETVKIEN